MIARGLVPAVTNRLSGARSQVQHAQQQDADPQRHAVRQRPAEHVCCVTSETSARIQPTNSTAPTMAAMGRNTPMMRARVWLMCGAACAWLAHLLVHVRHWRFQCRCWRRHSRRQRYVAELLKVFFCATDELFRVERHAEAAARSSAVFA
jgi:hypothetical protein